MIEIEENKYFGPAWNSFIAGLEQAPTPVGEPCLHCEELFEAGDQGLLVPQPVHPECLTRMVSGSVGHQTGRCPCFGGDLDDPPGMTKRQAARAAEEIFRAKLQRRN